MLLGLIDMAENTNKNANVNKQTFFIFKTPPIVKGLKLAEQLYKTALLAVLKKV